MNAMNGWLLVIASIVINVAAVALMLIEYKRMSRAMLQNPIANLRLAMILVVGLVASGPTLYIGLRLLGVLVLH